ncbi:MAG TPA: putative porin [Candidatus Kapabacteria bacterium]|nr:putative porin [Candidatus Kapabacteria bacterium]
MNLKTHLLTGSVVLSGLSFAQAGTGLPWLDSNTNLTFYGDIRLRYEVDWDSQTAAGVERDDRHRGRIRGRLGFNYRLSDEWSVGSRVRTGDSRSQQSPHLTFVTDDGLRDELDFVVDRYFVQYKEGKLTSWGGRNIWPFWQQNELFWDEDVTPTGGAVSYDFKLGDSTLTTTAGAFYLPDGGYDLNGQLLGAQAKYTLPLESSQFTFAGALHFMNGETGANNLRNRNGERDYLLGVGNAQWSIPIKEIPFALGADVFYNFENYDADDTAPFPAADDDEVLGYVFSAQFGQLKDRNDWLVGYYYSHIETFAVNASYAQDDWHRFGSGTQTDASDFEGHEFRVAYAFSKTLNVVARLYLVDRITTDEDGNRFRVDLNWKF